jgi:predicted TIM-barrel fold metal-dependent hydrolase
MLDVDPAWLARGTAEAPIGVGFPIVDPHHHLWDAGPRLPYRLEELRADTGSGWDVEATVFVECLSHYWPEGPEHLRPVGETEYVEGEAVRSATDGRGARIAGIVSRADLTLGPLVEPALLAHLDAGSGLFRGIRHATSWDEDPTIRRNHARAAEGTMATPAFADGLRVLASLGLSFDAWLYHPQIPELTALARAVPEATIVLDHIGAPLAVGRWAGRADEVAASWRASIAELATCPNVVVKLGGIGMADYGGGWRDRPAPPSSEELAARWAGPIGFVIEQFGAGRCMFESNFPVDKASCGYVTLWNTFARIADGCSASEQRDLFRGTAARVYRLDLEP